MSTCIFCTRLFFLIISVVIITSSAIADLKGTKQSKEILKPTRIDRQKLDVNRALGWFRNDGEFYSDPSTTGGFEWPMGSGIHTIFSAALWIGAKVSCENDPNIKEIRVATAGYFGSEYKPGIILPDGSASYYREQKYRYYKVQPKIEDAESNLDFAQWPIEQGAPFHDLNNNGIYEPEIDRPAVIIADKALYPDMMLFAVYNDADPEYHNWIFGRSKPLGIEVRQLNYAFSQVFGDVHFINFRLYNKSNKLLDSVYLTFWIDPDLGYPINDYVGCDTSYDYFGKRQNLGYCYNADNFDYPGYGPNPPALGVKLLQGPTLYTGNVHDTATYFGKILIRYKNLDISSFNFFCKPQGSHCNDSNWWNPASFTQSYNIMSGLTRLGNPQVCLGDTVKFIFSGDPVTGTGCINSHLLPTPVDMKFTLSTGPFTMAPGDSQEVLYAVFVARVTDNLNSITELRNLSELIKLTYDNKFNNVPEATILPPNFYNPPYLLNLKVENAISIQALMRDKTGLLLGTAQLFDDGNHNDNSPNDGIWGNWLFSSNSQYGAYIDFYITYSNGKLYKWEKYLEGIPTIGRVKISDIAITLDNINQDGAINPGEYITCKVKLLNIADSQILNPTVILHKSLSPFIKIYEFKASNILDTINTGEESNWTDDPIVFYTSPSTPIGHLANLIFQIVCENNNVWYDTLEVTINKFTYPPIDTIPTQISGISESKFGIKLVDYSKLKNNDYKITISKISRDDRRFNLINLTQNDTLLKLQKLTSVTYHPDYDVPVTDGFKIITDDVVTKYGLKEWKYSNNNFWFTGVRYCCIFTDLKINERVFATYPTFLSFHYQSSVKENELLPIRIIFSNTNTQKAYRYIAGFTTSLNRAKHPEFSPFIKDSTGSGFLYQDFEQYPIGNSNYGNTVPFTVWELDRSGNVTRQLDVGIVERNDTLYKWNYISSTESTKLYLYYGNIDGKWNPAPYNNKDSRFGDEILLIFNTTYTDTPKFIFTGGTTENYIPHYDLLKNFDNVPVMYIVWMRRINANTTFNEGEILELIPYFPVDENDVYVFNPLKLLSSNLETPNNIYLYQNYPNPFNSNTKIKFQLPNREYVQLKIYNILGQLVTELIREFKDAGYHEIIWDAKNFPSGIYFYKLQTSTYSSVKKMVLIR